jgi:hypothetical protein
LPFCSLSVSAAGGLVAVPPPPVRRAHAPGSLKPLLSDGHTHTHTHKHTHDPLARTSRCAASALRSGLVSPAASGHVGPALPCRCCGVVPGP